MSGSTGRIAFGLVGAVVGAYFGNPYLGYAVGASIGGAVFPDELPDVANQGPKLGDLRIQNSAYGRALPIAFGVVRAAGTLIWSSGIVQHTLIDEQTQGGKGGGPVQDVTTTTYTYTASVAFSLCEGEILGVRRIWANGDLVYDAGPGASYATYIQGQTLGAAMRVYPGSETQDVDPLIFANDPDTPAYRGVAYLVFESLELGRFGNSVPNLEFEIVTQGSISSTLQQLDSLSQFGLGCNGTITPDGLLLVAYCKSFATVQLDGYLALVNPFDLSPIRDFNSDAYMIGTGAHASPGIAPRMNAAGDILFADSVGSFRYWPAGGAQSVITTDFPTRTWIDLEGNFYAAARLIDLRYAVFRVTGGVITVLRSYGTGSSGIIKDLWDSHDSFLWVSTNAPIIEKLDKNTGEVVASWVPNSVAHSITVGGDDSLWYLNGVSSNVKLWRVDAALTAEVKIYDEGGTHGGASATRLGRDWGNGDILYADGTAMVRYDEGGTLVQTNTTSTSMRLPYSDPAFPERIYTFESNISGGTPQFVHAYRSIIVSESTVSVADAITSICGKVGLVPADIDVAALTMQLRGYVIASRGPARSALQQLLIAFLADAVETATQIKFVLRGAASAATITEDDLGAKLAGVGEEGESYSIVRKQEPELPNELALNYLDVTASYQVGTQYGRRLIGHSENNQSINLAVVLTADEALHIALTLLYEAWAGRQQYKIAVSAKWSRLEPTDALTLSLLDGTTAVARLMRVTESQGVRELECLGYEPTIYTQDADGTPLPDAQTSITALAPTALELIDGPLLRDVDDGYGFYIAACGYTSNWPGAKLFKSADAVAYADAAISIPLPVAMGYTLTALANFVGGNTFDETNTVEVSVLDGTLSSTSEANVLNGANAAILGGEVIQYKNAVLLATNRYRLSGLLRGRLGTNWAMALHVVGQPFVKLDQTLLRTLTTPVSDQSTTRYFKGVTFGTPLAQAAAKPLLVASNRLKPLAPTHIGGGRDASNNVTINWVRCARKAHSWVDTIDVGLDETSEAYEVDLFAGTGSAVGGVTNALDGVFAVSAHSLIVGDVIHVRGIVGMTPLNDRSFTVRTVVDANHFTVGENTAGYTAYSSAGTVRKRARTVSVASATTTSYSAANQTTDYGSAQATVYCAIYQTSARVGRGYAGIGVV